MKKMCVLFLLAMFFITCGPSAKFLAPDYSRPRKVAILPTVNHTNDVECGIVMRNLFFVKLHKKKYAELLSNTVVDSILNEEGITDGGQLNMITREELAEILTVDGLLYIDLLKCTCTPLVPGEVGTVKANFKLYVPPSKLIWEDEREEVQELDNSSSGSGGNPLADLVGSLIAETAAKLMIQAASGWLFDHELHQEMDKLIKKSLKTLP
ncbi:MAG: DUF799 family lipoprotein [Calditrichaceae bacterium]|nr:DUF799 domain-containing protein [Calditrichia bacterium]NUQ40225.1 DUF799 family lipoprotein [Calditrichaceae bacterium]